MGTVRMNPKGFGRRCWLLYRKRCEAPEGRGEPIRPSASPAWQNGFAAMPKQENHVQIFSLVDDRARSMLISAGGEPVERFR